MSKVFRWLWVMLEYYSGGQDGYVVGQSMIHYTNRGECTKAARAWLDTATVEKSPFGRGPYLIVETLDGDKNKY